MRAEARVAPYLCYNEPGVAANVWPPPLIRRDCGDLLTARDLATTDTLVTQPADRPGDASAPERAAELLRQIEQMQAAIADQQRSLMRAPDESARAAALRATGLLVRQLVDLQESARQLDRDLHALAAERGRLRALQEVGAAINSSLDLDVVLQQVMDAIVRLTRAERAMLLLDNNGELELKMARNVRCV